jgi:Family of unknown function (DUF5719)
MSADGNGDGRAGPGVERRPAPDEPDPDEPTSARHRQGGSRRTSTRGRPDRRSLAIRLPFVVALAAALAGAVVVDRAGGDPAPADAPGPRPVPLVVASTAESGSSTWFCAAGTATDGGMADHTVVMLNPTERHLAATVTVFTGEVLAPAPAPGPAPATAPATDGPGVHRQVTRDVDLPAGGRVAVALGDVVEAPLAAALVEVDGGGVAVEHHVRGEHGADVAPCTTSAAPTWHLAWGSTARDARELVVLFNPFPSPATVDAVFATPDGRREPVRFQGLPVPGRSVVGIDVGREVTRADQVAATFEVRSGRVVVERLQQFDGSLGVEGLSVATAVPAAAGAWVFGDGEASAPAPTTPPPDEVEGPPGGEDAAGADADARLATSERIVVYNPGGERAEVEVEVVPTTDEPGPPVPPFSLSVRAGGYEVLDYGEHDRIVPGVAHATIVRSTGSQPVVVERATVDGAPSAATPQSPSSGQDGGDEPLRRHEITASPGARLAAPGWLFPSVALLGVGHSEGDGEGVTVRFAVLNPDPDRAVEVEVTPAGAAWPPVGGTAGDASRVEVPPGARVAVDLDDEATAGMVAALVEAGGPVVVERTVLAADGRRLAMGAGIPLAEGAVVLSPQRGGGLLGAGYAP